MKRDVEQWMKPAKKTIYFSDLKFGHTYEVILTDFLDYNTIRDRYIEFNAMSCEDYNDIGLTKNMEFKLHFSIKSFQHQWQMKNDTVMVNHNVYNFKVIFKRVNIKRLNIISIYLLNF